MNDSSRPDYTLTSNIISAAIEVHQHLGPGLLERAYEECLAAELAARGIQCQRQVIQPLIYRNVELAKSYTIDMVVDNRVLLELKAIRILTDSDIAQTLTYLKLSRLPVALLINFNAYPLYKGIRRFVHTKPHMS